MVKKSINPKTFGSYIRELRTSKGIGQRELAKKIGLDLKKLYEVSFNKEHTIHKCGKSENGFYNMSYKEDIFGFRENDNQLFYDTDIIIVGDSFGLSSCVNFPYDLNTKLKKNKVIKKF